MFHVFHRRQTAEPLLVKCFLGCLSVDALNDPVLHHSSASAVDHLLGGCIASPFLCICCAGKGPPRASERLDQNLHHVPVMPVFYMLF